MSSKREGEPDYGDPVSSAQIDERFRPKDTLSGQQFERIVSLRETGRILSRHILRLCPPSWEREEALRLIDLATLMAEQSVRRHE